MPRKNIDNKKYRESHEKTPNSKKKRLRDYGDSMPFLSSTTATEMCGGAFAPLAAKSLTKIVQNGRQRRGGSTAMQLRVAGRSCHSAAATSAHQGTGFSFVPIIGRSIYDGLSISEIRQQAREGRLFLLGVGGYLPLV